METILRKAGMAPEHRQSYGKYDIFIADGFSSPPHQYYKKFGVEPDEFPFGCYVTFWWVSKDEELDTGQPLFFDAFHDKSLSKESKKGARINSALAEAEGFLIRRGKVALNG